VKHLVRSETLRHVAVTETTTVTLPGTSFTVTYRKLTGLPDLVATNVVDDRRVAMKKADFLTGTLRIANNRRESLIGLFSPGMLAKCICLVSDLF
jgi:hypothetical protein